MEIIDGKEHINQKESLWMFDVTREELIESLGEGIYSRKHAFPDKGNGWDGDIREKFYAKDLVMKIKENKIKNGRRGNEALRILVKNCKELFLKKYKDSPTGIKQFKEGNFNFLALYNKSSISEMGLYSQSFNGDIVEHNIKEYYIENIVNLSGKASEISNFFFEDLI